MEASTIITLIGLGIGHLIELGAFIWYLSGQLSSIKASTESNGKEIVKVEETLEGHIKKHNAHVQDSAVHTTFEQRQAIGAKFDRLEDAMKAGHSELGSKIDRWAEKIMAKG